MFLSVLLSTLLLSRCCTCYYVVYLEGYPGELKLIELPDLSVASPPMLDLSTAKDLTPSNLVGRCGNPDVSPDGSTIVFGAITEATDSWDIYIASLDASVGTLSNVRLLVDTNKREEDPRYSYDGLSIVYKTGTSSPVWYDIDLYNFSTNASSRIVTCSCDEQCPTACDVCELWGPSLHPCGNTVSYTARVCDNSVDKDTVYTYDFVKAVTTQVSADNNLPDMYSHFLRDGTLLYSHNDGSKDNIWKYSNNGSSLPTLFLDETTSDDDAYGFKQSESNDFVFIGIDEGYQLFVYRKDFEPSVTQLTAGQRPKNMLGPVVFSTDVTVTVPQYCANAATNAPTDASTDASTEAPTNTATNEPTEDSSTLRTIPCLSFALFLVVNIIFFI